MHQALSHRINILRSHLPFNKYRKNHIIFLTKLTYRPDKSLSFPHPFTTYSNSDHAGCIDTRRSTSGYVIKIGTGAVSWSSKKQVTVALSSTKAEYIASVAAGKEIIWMRTLFKELHFDVKNPSPMMMDNWSALAVIKNSEHHGQMKHIDISHHWIWQVVKNKDVAVHYIPTGEMIADILTKALPWILVKWHHLGLGIM